MSKDGMTFGELSQVVPPSSMQVVVGGTTYTIKRFGLRTLKEAAAHGYFIWTLYDAVSKGVISPVDLILDGGDSVIALMELSSGAPAGTFDDVDPVEAFSVITAIVQLNMDFFVNVLAKTPEMVEQVSQAVKKVNQQNTAGQT